MCSLNLMRNVLFFLVAGIVVLLVIVLFILFQVVSSSRLASPVKIAIPTVVPGAKQGLGNTLSKPPIKYDSQKTNQLIQKSKQRQALSADGAKIKIQLAASLNGSGTLYSSSNITIEYIASPDLFQAEIKNANVSGAKQEAVNWMISKGFSREDICKLPFSFYLNGQVSDQLRNSGTTFNPLPDGC